MRRSAHVRDDPARSSSHACARLRQSVARSSEEDEMAGARSKQLTGVERERAIIDLIRSVPEGFVTTYGDLCPEAPRLPGRILATTSEKVPWHRIVRADGTLRAGGAAAPPAAQGGHPLRGQARRPRRALTSRARRCSTGAARGRSGRGCARRRRRSGPRVAGGDGRGTRAGPSRDPRSLPLPLRESTTRSSASTTCGSNWDPAPASSSRRAAASGIAARYGRSVVIAS